MSHVCDESIQKLYQYLDSELDQETADQIRTHLEECGPCWDSFDFERRLKAVVHSHLSEDMPDELLDKVRDLIRSETSGEPA